METHTTTNTLFQWNAPERPPVQRGHIWYAVVGLSALLAALWSIVTAAWTLTIVIILGGAMYYQHLKIHAKNRTIEIRQDGIYVNGVCTPWNICSGFWIYKHDSTYVLHIEKIRGWEREMTTVMEENDYQDIATLLSTFLPYHATRRENILDSFIRICKL